MPNILKIHSYILQKDFNSIISQMKINIKKTAIDQYLIKLHNIMLYMNVF